VGFNSLLANGFKRRDAELSEGYAVLGHIIKMLILYWFISGLALGGIEKSPRVERSIYAKEHRFILTYVYKISIHKDKRED